MALIYVAEFNEIPENRFMIVTVKPGVTAGVIRRGTQILSYVNLCPHAAAPVCQGAVLPFVGYETEQGIYVDPDKKIISCPWHGWEFELTTGKGLVENTGNLKSIPIEKKAQKVYLKISS